ncbi:SDR family NAD(P)-dependent oxidoreductase, partial [Streptomyces sp. NPDC059459]|uniref:beta-ketoacyl reductase n=1 Tax=Streptomyces sp. NPDC059459 TaxID=3346839 RepID=UPI003698CA02
RRGRPEREVFEAAVATVFTRDADLDVNALHPGPTGRRVDLPTYPFQRDRYWLDPTRTTATDTEAAGATANGLRYRVTWQPAVVDRGSPRPAGRVLLLAPDEDTADSGLATALARELTVRGAEVHTVVVPVGTGREAAADLLRAAGDHAARSTRVLWLAPSEPDTADAVALVQALGEAAPDAPLWVTTREAVAVRPDEVPSVGGAQLWGLGQVAALELGARWGGLADLPGSVSSAVLRRFVGALLAGEENNQFAVRPSGVHVRRVVPAPRPSPDPGSVSVTDGRWSSGTVLITGGTGALGAQVARRLARSGAAHLLLVARRGADGPGVGALVEELTALGAEVTVEACDVADRNALAALLAGIPEDRPLTAVLHAAGVLDDGVLDSLTSDRVDAVLRAKVAAARHLDELTADLPLDAFVLFSSIVGVWGNGGQAAYAAANAALDALAQRRRARGGPAASIAWGPWAGAGMASGTAATSFERDGVAALDPERALDVLGEVMGVAGTSTSGTPAAGGASLLVADVDWETFVGRSVTRRTWSLFDGVPAARSARTSHAAADHAALTRGSGRAGSGQDGDEGRPWLSVGLSSAERRRSLLTLVRSEAAGILRHASVDAVDPELAFRSAGFDSLTVLELRNRLTAVTGLNLPNTLLFDHPTPVSLASHLHDELFGADGEADPVAATPAPTVTDEREPIAIVGMACRYPGGVASPDDLWNLVAGDGHTLSPFPADRGWDIEGLYDPEPGVPGRSYVREGGFLHSAAEFDAEFFG